MAELNTAIPLSSVQYPSIMETATQAMSLKDMMEKSAYNRAVLKQQAELMPYKIQSEQAAAVKAVAEAGKAEAETDKIQREAEFEKYKKTLDLRKGMLDIAAAETDAKVKSASWVGQQAKAIEPYLVGDSKNPAEALRIYNEVIFPAASAMDYYDKKVLPDLTKIADPAEAIGPLATFTNYATAAALTNADRDKEALRSETERHNKEMEAIQRIIAKKPPAGINVISPIPPAGGRTPEQRQWVSDQVSRIDEGSADPLGKDISARSPLKNLWPDVQEAWQEQHPGESLINMGGDRAYWNSPKTRGIVQTMNVVSEQLPKLQEAVKKVKSMGIQKISSATISALKQAGSAEAAEYLASIAVTTEDIAKALAGGNSITDKQLAFAENLMPVGATVEQFEKYINQIAEGVDSRKATVYQQGGAYGRMAAKKDPYLDPELKEKVISGKFRPEKGKPTQIGMRKVWQGKTWIQVGIDPSKRESWEELQETPVAPEDYGAETVEE